MKRYGKKILAVLLGVMLMSGFAGGEALADVAEPCDVHSYDYDCDPTCNVCGYERTAGHTYDLYGQNYSYHWQKCDCGAKLDPEAHVYDNGEDLTCSVCGYVRHLEHTYQIAGSDMTHHWEECDCGEIQHKEVHSFVQKHDGIWHWLECDCGIREDVAVHVWGEGQTEGEATRYTCTICGAEKVINADGSESAETGDPTEDNTEQPDNTGEQTGDNGESGGNDEDDAEEPSAGKKVGRVVGGVIGGIVALWGGAVAGYFIYQKRRAGRRVPVAEPVVEEIKETPEEEIKVDLDILDRIEEIGETEEPKDTI